MGKIICEDCGSRKFSVYSEKLLACDDCAQIFDMRCKEKPNPAIQLIKDKIKKYKKFTGDLEKLKTK